MTVLKILKNIHEFWLGRCLFTHKHKFRGGPTFIKMQLSRWRRKVKNKTKVAGFIARARHASPGGIITKGRIGSLERANYGRGSYNPAAFAHRTLCLSSQTHWARVIASLVSAYFLSVYFSIFPQILLFVRRGLTGICQPGRSGSHDSIFFFLLLFYWLLEFPRRWRECLGTAARWWLRREVTGSIPARRCCTADGDYRCVRFVLVLAPTRSLNLSVAFRYAHTAIASAY